MFVSHKFHIVGIEISCRIDRIQPWKFKLLSCNCQVFWTIVTLPVIVHILFCITLYIFGRWNGPVCSSRTKAEIHTKTMCMDSWTNTNTNIILNFHNIINCKFCFKFFLLQIESIAPFNYVSEFSDRSRRKLSWSNVFPQYHVALIF